MPELHDYEIPVELLREDQCRTCRKRPGPAGPFRPGARIDAYDLLQLLVIERLVVRGLVHFGDFEAGLDGRLHRPRKILDVAGVRIQGAIPGIGLRVEVSRDEQRFAA